MTPSIIQAATKGVDCCRAHLLTVEFVEKYAQLEPAFADLARELRTQHDHLKQVCEGTLLLSGAPGG